jgi:hypothetical protein
MPCGSVDVHMDGGCGRATEAAVVFAVGRRRRLLGAGLGPWGDGKDTEEEEDAAGWCGARFCGCCQTLGR